MIKVIYVESDSDKAYGLVSGVFMSVATSWSTLSDADKLTAYQKCDEGTATVDTLRVLGKFKAYVYSTGNNVVGISRPTANGTGDWTQTQTDGGETYAPHCIITALPQAQIVTPKALMPLYGASAIQSVAMTGTVTDDSTIAVAVTTDLSAYKTYNFDAKAWQDIDATSSTALLASGIPIAKVADIPASAWAEFGTEGLAFVYCIKQSTLDNSTAHIDRTSLTMSLIGRWDKAINGADYRYGYLAGNGVSINATFLKPGSYKINYTNADSTRTVESGQEAFGFALEEGNTDDNGILVDSKGDTLL